MRPRHVTRIYLETDPKLIIDRREHVKTLTDGGFDVISTWHLSPPKSLRAEMLKVLGADMLLAYVDTLRPQTWLKIGFASASGIRVVAIGKTQHPELDKFFILQVDSFDDLVRNQFVKLGTGMSRTPTDWIKK